MNNNIDLLKIVNQVVAAAEAKGPNLNQSVVPPDSLRPASPPDEVLYDVCGRRRSPATLRSFRLGKAPNNKGKKYPATPPTDLEVLRMLDAWPTNPAGRRGHAAMVLQFRSGLRIAEVLALKRHDLNAQDGTVFVANGKGGKARLVGMDPWGFDQIMPWVDYRYKRYPAGPVMCIVQGPTRGQQWSTAAARAAYHYVGELAEIDRRVACHQLRHALAVSMARQGLPLHVISKQLGHGNVATTATYLAGISNEECVTAVRARPAPGATTPDTTNYALEGASL